MLCLVQAWLWISFLPLFAAPVFGAHIIGSPIFRALEVSSETPASPGSNFEGLPTEVIDDKFDAFQESFADGVASFDDDFKDYVNENFVDIGVSFGPAPDAQDSHLSVAEGPAAERTTEELNTPPIEGPPTNEPIFKAGLAMDVLKPIAEAELMEAGIKPVLGAELAEAETIEAELTEAKIELAPARFALVSEPLAEVMSGSAGEAESSAVEPVPAVEPVLEFEPAPAVEVVEVTEIRPTRTELAPEVNDPGLLNQICRSHEFQPTLENWWIFEADQWLRNYTVENGNSPAFRAFGLVGSIAGKYLPTTDFRCEINPVGGFRSDTCRVSCVDIVDRVNDIEEARRAYFVLSGVVGLAERIGGIYNATGQVPRGVASLVEGMPTKGGLNTPADLIGGILFNSIDSTLFAASPWIPTAKVYHSSNEALQAAKHYYDMAVQASSLTASKADPYKWDKIFDSSYEMSLAELDLAPKGYANDTTPIPEGMREDTWYSKAVLKTRRALEDARALAAVIESGDLVRARNEGFELFKELFAYSPSHPRRAALQDFEPGIEGILSDAAGRARTMLADVLAELLNGGASSFNGTTNLSKLLRYGHYLPAGPEESISSFRKANIAEIIARDVFMELFDNSIRQQLVYISCTEDKQQRMNPRKDAVGSRVNTCSRDNTGPQNLKACFGNTVCYLYEWNERPMSHMSRNREPEGHRDWDESPWSIEPQDIILSSLATHLTKDFVPRDIAEEADFYYETVTLDTLRDPRSADHFKIPVCMSAHNWNTRLDGWNTFCDTSKHCTAKNLPCQCGASGKDTRSLWEEIGIWNSPQHDYYSATLCPRQIQKRISDPLERYIAYCNLGIKRRGNRGNRVDGARRYQGRDKYCDVITNAVGSQPNGLVSDLDPETRFMFLCQIHNGGRGCNMYQKNFDALWQAVNSGEPGVDEGAQV